MRAPRTALAVAVGATALALVAGCTSASPPDRSVAPSSTAPSTTAVPSSTAPAPATTSASAPSTSAAPSTTPPVQTGPPPSSPAPTGAPAQPLSTCSSLMIMVLRGSGIAGREFAALQFTNNGSTSCTLYGYPTVTLSRGGKQIGTVSRPSGSALSVRHLAPGQTAQSRLDVYVMNCQAPVSDTVHVVAPRGSQTASATVQLRACPMRVEPLTAPD